jgi:hypothetical protein
MSDGAHKNPVFCISAGLKTIREALRTAASSMGIEHKGWFDLGEAFFTW